MESILSFIQAHRPYFEVAQALSSVANLIAWLLALLLLIIALRKNRIESLSVGPFSFRMVKEEAIVATATASRAWKSATGQKVDVPRIRATIDRVFTPEARYNLIGKAVLWVDDNPSNNELAVRAFRKFGLDVEQAVNTEMAVATIQRRQFDLIISDMGRGADLRAGYNLLKLLRDKGNNVPFVIFAGSDSPQFRREAAELGAQLSTNDMLELVDYVVNCLGRGP